MYNYDTHVYISNVQEKRELIPQLPQASCPLEGSSTLSLEANRTHSEIVTILLVAVY